MAFYEIIFGLLFIGAFREVIFALSEGPDWRLFCLTATLSVLVFSDTLYTAVVIEGKKIRYSVPMKLLDLMSFILLSFAVVILNPSENDMFEVDVTKVLDAFVYGYDLTRETLFWSLLTAYMCILIIWNHLLGVGRVKWSHRWVKLVQPLMALVFLWMAWRAAMPDALLHDARWLVLGMVFLYLVAFKTAMSEILDAGITLEDLTDDDVASIRKWPKYDGPFAELDYALRPGGWLDMYPSSKTNKRYGIWQNGKLVGFTLLTEINKDNKEDAEFYIALHPDQIRQRLGREGTEKTVSLGFKKFGLKRIHLKVRVEHPARKLYTRAGFKECGLIVEKVQGKPVEFSLMELKRPPFFKKCWSSLCEDLNSATAACRKLKCSAIAACRKLTGSAP